MQCDKCAKEFSTYSGVCPFCHHKNEKDNQSIVKYTHIVNPDLPISDTPSNSPGNISPRNSSGSRKAQSTTLRYALTGGIAILVVLSVAAMAQSLIGGSSSIGSAPEISITPEETIPSFHTVAVTSTTAQPRITYSGSNAGTLSPYGGNSDPIAGKPVAPDYTAPGYRRGENPSVEPGIMVLVTPYPIVSEYPSGNIGNNAGADPGTIISNPPPVINNPPPAINSPVPVAKIDTKTPTPTPTSTPRQPLTQDSRSMGERNAANDALSYLRSSSFSRDGLIKQLEYEGYTHPEAVYGVDQSGADWNEQAAKSAASYLRSSSFSRKELIDQLEYEGFTPQQAAYGVQAVGY